MPEFSGTQNENVNQFISQFEILTENLLPKIKAITLFNCLKGEARERLTIRIEKWEYETIKETLISLYSPRLSELSDRKNSFFQRVQKKNETTSEYLEDKIKLAYLAKIDPCSEINHCIYGIDRRYMHFFGRKKFTDLRHLMEECDHFDKKYINNMNVETVNTVATTTTTTSTADYILQLERENKALKEKMPICFECGSNHFARNCEVKRNRGIGLHHLQLQ